MEVFAGAPSAASGELAVPLAPSSKLAAARWVSDDVLITGLPVTSDDACYRAMDWLLEIKDQLERKVFDNLADLLNLEVDLLFFGHDLHLLRDRGS